jgi:hypothetical protein
MGALRLVARSAALMFRNLPWANQSIALLAQRLAASSFACRKILTKQNKQ